MRRVIRVVQDQRDARYGLLRGYFHGADDDTVDELQTARLASVTLPLGAQCVGRALADQALHAVACRWCLCAARREPSPSRVMTRCWPRATRWCCRVCRSRWRWPRRSSSARREARSLGAHQGRNPA